MSSFLGVYENTYGVSPSFYCSLRRGLSRSDTDIPYLLKNQASNPWIKAVFNWVILLSNSTIWFLRAFIF
jgi:hypothetical protein